MERELKSDVSNGERKYLLVDGSNLEISHKVMLSSIEGILNREAPSMFVMLDERNDGHWVEWYCHYGMTPVQISLEELVDRCAPNLEGCVVFDPELPQTTGIAITLSGISDLVVLSPELSERFPQFKVKEDLRGRWNDPVSAYQWAYQNLFPKCSRDILCTMNPGQPKIDYAIANRAFMNMLSINRDYPEEAAFTEALMSEIRPLGFACGFITTKDLETLYVDACSRHGLIQICSSGASNLSFHRHIQAKGEFRQEHAKAEDLLLDGKTTYITFCQSDGDALHSMVNLQQGNWFSPLRGAFPYGWQIAPRLAWDLGPALLEYYYATKSANDYLVMGPSGIGYNYPSVFKGIDDFLELTKLYMDKTDTRAIWNIDRVAKQIPGGFIQHRTKVGDMLTPIVNWMPLEELKNKYGADFVNDDIIGEYCTKLPRAIGFFQGFEEIPGEEERFVNGRPYLPTKIMAVSPEQCICEIENLCRSSQKKPLFIPIHVSMCSPMNRRTMGKMLKVVEYLDRNGYKIVRPDEFLYLRAKAFRQEGKTQ